MRTTAVLDDLMYRLLEQSVKDYAIYLLDGDGTVLNWNAGAERALGYRTDEIVGRNYDCFYSAEERRLRVPRANLDVARREGHFSTEGWRYRKDGTPFWASVALDAVHDETGAFLGFAKVTRDLTEQREAARRFEHQASHDLLTGILNRAGIVEILRACLAESGPLSSLAVHVVDLDRFKPINDTFGHPAGDVVLQRTARRLEEVAGHNGLVGRLGGDEFVLIQFDAIDLPAIQDKAYAIIVALNAPIDIGQALVRIGGSVGVAVAPRDGEDVDTIFRHADLALYRAKSDGPGCARIFDSVMSEQALARGVLELKLRHAVAANDFRLVYQPVVDGRTAAPIGYEALLRWTDQTGASVSPATFIPLAEEIGLMPELGEWVLREACREAVTWPGDLVVSVNLSVKQLEQPDLALRVSRILEEAGLAPRRLELEVTETAVLGDLETARETLSLLRDLGVGIALDDFGTGFSSLSLVRELPLTRIKIDRSFVSDIEAGGASNAIVASVIALCRGCGLATTAEGVETAQQWDGLVARGCVDLQGYFFGRPALWSHWEAAALPAATVGGA